MPVNPNAGTDLFKAVTRGKRPPKSKSSKREIEGLRKAASNRLKSQ